MQKNSLTDLIKWNFIIRKKNLLKPEQLNLLK